MEYKAILVMDLNPEPWTSGTLSTGYNGKKRYPVLSKDQRLIDYQDGISDNIKQAYPELTMFPEEVQLHLIFKFWRQIDSFTGGTGRTQHRQIADATNLTKALEDALQGVLYKNDRQVKHSEGEIIMEGPDVMPRILILCAERHRPDPKWQELANSLEVNPGKPMPPGNVYYTKYVMS